MYTYKSLCQLVRAQIADLDTSRKANSYTGELFLSDCMDLQRIAVKSAPGSRVAHFSGEFRESLWLSTQAMNTCIFVTDSF